MTKQKEKPMRKVNEEYCEFCDKIIKGTEKVILLTDGEFAHLKCARGHFKTKCEECETYYGTESDACGECGGELVHVSKKEVNTEFQDDDFETLEEETT